jgi:hypothetical protein
LKTEYWKEEDRRQEYRRQENEYFRGKKRLLSVSSCLFLFLCLCDLRVLCGKGSYFFCVGLWLILILSRIRRMVCP